MYGTDRPQANQRKLTRKEQAFVKEIIKNPKAKPEEIVKEAGYAVKNDTNAKNIYYQNMERPAVISALGAYSELAENTIVKSIVDFGNSDRQWQRVLAVETSKWVHDKVHGKAVQQNINVNQDFSKQADAKRQEYGL